MRGQRHAPAALYLRERPCTHCTGGWVGPRAGLDRCGKSRPPGIRSPDRPARSQSLYQLSYPAPFHSYIKAVLVWVGKRKLLSKFLLQSSWSNTESLVFIYKSTPWSQPRTPHFIDTRGRNMKYSFSRILKRHCRNYISAGL